MKKILFIVVIGLFFLAFLVFGKQLVLAQIQNSSPATKGTDPMVLVRASKVARPLPVRLKAPSVKIDAAVEYTGITSGGTMDVPSNTIAVGWYKFGPSPGEAGNAVISGHFDGRVGEQGVFNNLDKLKRGDKIYVTNDLGKTMTFIVKESRKYNPGYVEEVFSAKDLGIHLNLITCDGTWDEAKKSYSKRLVVFSDLEI